MFTSNWTVHFWQTILYTDTFMILAIVRITYRSSHIAVLILYFLSVETRQIGKKILWKCLYLFMNTFLKSIVTVTEPVKLRNTKLVRVSHKQCELSAVLSTANCSVGLPPVLNCKIFLWEEKSWNAEWKMGINMKSYYKKFTYKSLQLRNNGRR